MLFSSSDFWLIYKNKNGSLKTNLSRDISFQRSPSRYISFERSPSNLYILPKEFDSKVSCEISFHNLVCRLLLLFLWWTRGLLKKQTNKWHQIVSSASNQRTQFVGFTLQTRDFAPLTRWHRKLWKGIFRREGQPQHFKRSFFLKNRPIHFHINNTIVIRPVKQNQLSFPSIEIDKPLLTPVHSVS